LFCGNAPATARRVEDIALCLPLQTPDSRFSAQNIEGRVQRMSAKVLPEALHRALRSEDSAAFLLDVEDKLVALIASWSVVVEVLSNFRRNNGCRRRDDFVLVL
jgi:hypothetical protein